MEKRYKLNRSNRKLFVMIKRYFNRAANSPLQVIGLESIVFADFLSVFVVFKTKHKIHQS